MTTKRKTTQKKKPASKQKKKTNPYRLRHERDAIFFAYAGLGAKRSFAALSRITGIPAKTIESWSVKDGWKERMRELDASIRRQVEQEIVKDIVPTIVELEKLRKKTIENAMGRMDAGGAASNMKETKAAWEIARTELGLPTKFSKIDSTVERILTTEDLEDMSRNGVVEMQEDEEIAAEQEAAEE